MRTTVQQGKVKCCGHNDRSATDNARNIDHDRSHLNTYYSCNGIQNEYDCMLKFYTDNYSNALQRTNSIYLESRHKEKVKTMQQFFESKRYRPEEVIWQVGKMEEHATPEQFKECVSEMTRYISEKYGSNVHILYSSIHLDEATPHCHMKLVYDCKDQNGNLTVNKEGALRELGIPLKDPSKAEGRYNNRGMVFTEDLRNQWNNIAERITQKKIDRVPVPNRFAKSVDDYVREKTEHILNDKINDLVDPLVERNLLNAQEKINNSISFINGAMNRMNAMPMEMINDMNKIKQSLTDASKSLDYSLDELSPNLGFAQTHQRE